MLLLLVFLLQVRFRAACLLLALRLRERLAVALAAFVGTATAVVLQGGGALSSCWLRASGVRHQRVVTALAAFAGASSAVALQAPLVLLGAAAGAGGVVPLAAVGGDHAAASLQDGALSSVASGACCGRLFAGCRRCCCSCRCWRNLSLATSLVSSRRRAC